jgi:hypothetical protein
VGSTHTAGCSCDECSRPLRCLHLSPSVLELSTALAVPPRLLFRLFDSRRAQPQGSPEVFVLNHSLRLLWFSSRFSSFVSAPPSALCSAKPQFSIRVLIVSLCLFSRGPLSVRSRRFCRISRICRSRVRVRP